MDNKEEAKASILRYVKPGDTLFTILRRKSASGMSRLIDIYKMSGNDPLRMTWGAAVLTGHSYDKKAEAMRVNGCGMDMGFHAVYGLSSALFPEGFACTGKDCPSNDHSNMKADDCPDWHKDGGYALRQRWL